MTKSGSDPMQAIRAGTADAADLLGLTDEIGTIERGKRADLLTVGEDPSRDIEALRDMRLVLRDGLSVFSDI